MINPIGNSWLLTSDSESDHSTYGFTGGTAVVTTYNSSTSELVYPTVFLNSNESIVEGTTGTEDNPYKLNP